MAPLPDAVGWVATAQRGPPASGCNVRARRSRWGGGLGARDRGKDPLSSLVVAVEQTRPGNRRTAPILGRPSPAPSNCFAAA